MNETTEKLIRDLAEKLGTTADHLWGVLVKQAPISATCDLIEAASIFLALSIALVWLYYRWIKMWRRECDWEQPQWVLPCILVTIIWVITVLVIVSSMADTISGFVNPEYWALKQLLAHK